MIHEIAPHCFYNEFRKVKPNKNDVLMYFEGNMVALITRNQELRLPILNEFEELGFDVSDHLEYLFTIDTQAFFLYKESKLTLEDNISLYPLDVFREFSIAREAFAGIVASQIYRFHRDNAYCGRCGSKTQALTTERALSCPDCGHVVYPKISPAIIVAITDGKRLLMTRYARGSYSKYALVAGYVDVGETLEEAVHREVMEEVGLKIKNLTYYKSAPWPFSDSLMVGYFAQLDGDDTITLQESELSEATWFEYDKIPENNSTLSISQELVRCVKEGRYR